MRYVEARKVPQANIQAELFYCLRERNIFCVLDYRADKGVKFDVAVIHGDDVVCIVEVKSRVRERVSHKLAKVERCERYGIPVLLCVNFNNVKDTIEEIERIINQRS